MKTKSLITQTLIFIVPAIVATLLFPSDDFPPIQQLAVYRCGSLGIFLIVYLSEFLLISEDFASIIIMLIYVLFFLSLYIPLYRGSTKQLLIFQAANIALSIWGIVSGGFYMMEAVQ